MDFLQPLRRIGNLTKSYRVNWISWVLVQTLFQNRFRSELCICISKTSPNNTLGTTKIKIGTGRVNTQLSTPLPPAE